MKTVGLTFEKPAETPAKKGKSAAEKPEAKEPQGTDKPAETPAKEA